MLAMLRKDIYVIWKYIVAAVLPTAILPVVYARLGTWSGALYYVMPVFSCNIVLSAIDADVYYHWDRFIMTTSLRPWKLVVEKYLLAYGVLALLTGLSALAVRVSAGTISGAELWTAVVLVLLASAMLLPLVYRCGRRTASMIMMAVWGLAAAAILGMARLNYALIERSFGWMETVPVPALAAGIVIFLAAVNIWSVRLSIRFYTRRQRGWYDQDGSLARNTIRTDEHSP